jgi:hypothetical protein
MQECILKPKLFSPIKDARTQNFMVCEMTLNYSVKKDAFASLVHLKSDRNFIWREEWKKSHSGERALDARRVKGARRDFIPHFPRYASDSTRTLFIYQLFVALPLHTRLIIDAAALDQQRVAGRAWINVVLMRRTFVLE